jgi:hypothetical protein
LLTSEAKPMRADKAPLGAVLTPNFRAK